MTGAMKPTPKMVLATIARTMPGKANSRSKIRDRIESTMPRFHAHNSPNPVPQTAEMTVTSKGPARLVRAP